MQSQVAQIIAREGWEGTPLGQNISVRDKFVMLLESLDELGHLLSADLITREAICRQTFKLAALASMFGESMMEDV